MADDGGFLFFDCETTGLPRTRHFSPDDVSGWPRLVQLAWGLYDLRGEELARRCHIVKPKGFVIPAEATLIHGISHDQALRTGKDLRTVVEEFRMIAERPGVTLVAHNLDYDCGVMAGELVRLKKPLDFLDRARVCTMKETTDFCRLPRPGGGWGYKWPTLIELHTHLFGAPYDGAHDAAADLDACRRCFFRLFEEGLIELP
jgi:DNA polymerase III epsilon subunit-like protein